MLSFIYQLSVRMSACLFFLFSSISQALAGGSLAPHTCYWAFLFRNYTYTKMLRNTLRGVWIQVGLHYILFTISHGAHRGFLTIPLCRRIQSDILHPLIYSSARWISVGSIAEIILLQDPIMSHDLFRGRGLQIFV